MNQPIQKCKKPSTTPVIGQDGRYHFVYRTINSQNGKFYLGIHSTKVLRDGYLGSGKILKLAIAKYGKDSFFKETLGYFKSREEAYLFEEFIVNEIIKNSIVTYNLKLGGAGGFHYINENGLNNKGKDLNKQADSLKRWTERNGGPHNKGKKLVIVNGKKTYR